MSPTALTPPHPPPCRRRTASPTSPSSASSSPSLDHPKPPRAHCPSLQLCGEPPRRMRLPSPSPSLLPYFPVVAARATRPGHTTRTAPRTLASASHRTAVPSAAYNCRWALSSSTRSATPAPPFIAPGRGSTPCSNAATRVRFGHTGRRVPNPAAIFCAHRRARAHTRLASGLTH